MSNELRGKEFTKIIVHESPINGNPVLVEKINDLEAALHEARTALEFYGDESMWSKGYQEWKKYSEIARRDNVDLIDEQGKPYAIGGRKAREALTKIKEILDE